MSVYYQDDLVTLHHGDWRELIDPTLQADLILTDPPYGETSLGWDVWPQGWPALAARHARSMWCFGSMRMFLNQRDEFVAWSMSQDVVWEKHNGSGFASDRFRRIHEHALHWYQGPWGDVHHDTPTAGPERTASRIRRGKTPHLGSNGEYGVIVGPRLMPSVLFAPSMHGTALNETEKPVGILEPLVRYGCPTGGLVLDLFAGSCSTLAAARAAGRRAVGFEVREDQCEKAARRLAQVVLDFGEAS